jgi:tRNA(Ile)-lysidine synthase
MEYTEKLGVTLLVETITPESLGKGPEGNARMAFKKLRDWAEREFDVVYIGHNKDDHIETVMIQLFRGAGKATRGIPDYHVGKIFRPLICMTRQNIRDACAGLGLKYFDDPSNEDTSMTRSFWRNEILPKLKEHYGEGLYKRIDNIAEKVSGA